MPSFPYFTTMFSSTTPASTRQLTPPTICSLTLPSTFPALQPVWCSAHTYRICTDESAYADMLTGMEDEDEVAAEEMDMAEVEERWSCLYPLAGVFEDAEVNVEEQQVCAPLPVPRSSFFGGEVSVECLFDAETPFASDEELWLRSVFDPVAAPCAVLDPLLEEEEIEEVTLVDTSELKLLPSVAVRDFRDPVAAWAEAEALPVEEWWVGGEEEVVVKREGRSLISKVTVSVPEAVLDTEVQETNSTWTLEDDPVLRYVTSQTFLPGLDNFSDISIHSAFPQYDNADIDALYQATTSFVKDRYDGECTCLDGKPAAPHSPGENYLLVNNEDVFGFSAARPQAEDIFELLDATVDADMEDFTPGYELTEDEDHVSDMSDSDADDVSMVQSSEWSYFDTDTQQYIGYTALEHLLQTNQPSELPYFDADSQQDAGCTAFDQILPIDADQMPPLVHRDFDELFDKLVEEVTALLQDELDKLDDIDPPPPQVETLTQPPRKAPVQERRLRGFRQVGPYMMYSSHQRSTMRSRRNVQLVLQPQQLYNIEEDKEEEDCLSPVSSAESLDFTTHFTVVKTLATRRANFLDDDEPESSMPSPASQATEPPLTDSQYEDMFADAIWTMSPDLALTNPSHTSSSSIVPVTSWSQHDFPPLPVLEAFATEIHNHLALIFDCLNTRRSHELPGLSNDLTWALNALASEYPSMTLLGSLGLAVEILVERMVASSVAS
ncbi:hypothetical protein PtrSN002B_007971 [Pyrenophora tritici-repentis]|uniref:DUF1421 multi-domain protein n=1 Tax=Pyrenophora tritici-repentis TaxID=45151 RepID=A0A2W1F371_9PLEO|nr:DUF1421 multi-domain protein [Pyrenophora tritici-repentis]KAG9383130.1 hypothetical protein A1F94_007051 [Pyrenophora tritici-repentis]KAI0588642.1 hypothetical protein Alg215_00826 [Pyrenophora tritici-repentis]KAI1543079.1 hypothetical protein PtrSN002B_007971 [Pyrenophora tritici-repentis]PWO21946.1 hypothetical protein PtrARCrB10_09545 [Pyrenophora tritici-repentis]